jgi:Tfp pilus assembly protein PilF
MQEDVAMEWNPRCRVESGTSTFTDAIKPCSDRDRSAARVRNGVAKLTFRRIVVGLLSGVARWQPAARSGEWYRDAFKTDPANPYANAMLAHWMLFRGDDVDGAGKLFEAALQIRPGEGDRSQPAVGGS